MKLVRMQLMLLLAVGLMSPSIFSQAKGVQNAAATPTANSFAYPQSVFVDSQNGHIWVTDFDDHRVLRFDVSTLTSVSVSRMSASPVAYALGQNYPNPFNPATQITFAPRMTGAAVLTVYNLLGQRIAVLFNGIATAHTVYTFSFDGRDLPSGMYVYSLRSASGTEVRKMCLLK